MAHARGKWNGQRTNGQTPFTVSAIPFSRWNDVQRLNGERFWKRFFDVCCSWTTQGENKKHLDEFEVRLVEERSSCVPCVAAVRVKSFINVRTEICRKYHILKTSASFSALWGEFITRTDAQPQPTFYKVVTSIVFEKHKSTTTCQYCCALPSSHRV